MASNVEFDIKSRVLYRPVYSGTPVAVVVVVVDHRGRCGMVFEPVSFKLWQFWYVNLRIFRPASTCLTTLGGTVTLTIVFYNGNMDPINLCS